MNNQAQKQDPAPLVSLWDGWAHVAPGMLKEIRGGNLNGKTDINPVWRFRALTQAFGPCGIGWTITEVERWKDEAVGEIACSVKIHLRINVGGTWSEPIEGVGGSKLCGKGRGEGINDEAWKMATTDAISVACKALGIAADVYTGKQSHKDADQKKDGPDYGTKYEGRNYAQNSTQSSGAGVRSTPRSNGQTAPVSAAPGPQYGPAPVYAGNGAPAPQYQQPAQQPQPQGQQRVHIILATVTTGRCKSIIEAQSKRDFDDLIDWTSGLDAIRARYDVDTDAMQEIEKRAVELRQARQQQQVSQMNDLPL